MSDRDDDESDSPTEDPDEDEDEGGEIEHGESISIDKTFHTRYLNVIKMLKRRNYDTKGALLRDLETEIDAKITELSVMNELFPSTEKLVLYFRANYFIDEEYAMLKLVYLRLLEGRKDISDKQIEAEMSEMIGTKMIDRVIILIDVPISKGGQRKIDAINSKASPKKPNQQFESFQMKDFAFDRISHRWVPKYTVMDEDEVEETLTQLQGPADPNEKLANFPTMMRSDPMAAYYGIKPKDFRELRQQKSGAVLKIERQNPVPRAYYRVVVHDYEVN